MAYKQLDNLIIENAEIKFPNFAGKRTDFNEEGKRKFVLVIDDENLANQLNEDGWNIKMKPDYDGEMEYRMDVEVSYRLYPPRIYLISNGVKTLLDEADLAALDGSKFKTIDLIINPYCWEKAGRSGIKAYLKTGYFVLEDDPFSNKYA